MFAYIKDEYKDIYNYCFEYARIVGKNEDTLTVRKNFKFYFINIDHVDIK